MNDRNQISYTYKGQPRLSCPIILGYSDDGREVVFAYQFGGRTSKERKTGKERRLPAWGCFYLTDVGELHAKPGKWMEGESHKQTQKCVKRIDVDVNIPDTLGRKEPLPFDSPELRPPRR